MNARERFLATLRFQSVDRYFHWESLGMWPETLARWYSEGLSPDLKHKMADDLGEMAADEYLRVLVRGFGMDRTDYLRSSVISGYTDSPFCPPFKRQVLHTDGTIKLVRDHDGILKREFMKFGSSSMPNFIEFPVKNRQDYHKLIPRLDPAHPSRFTADWPDRCQFYSERDFPVGLTICGAFGHPRNLMGLEGLCQAYYDDPSLIHTILSDWVAFYTDLCSRIWLNLRFDYLLIWEDMAYKGGSLISPRLVKRFMLPYYRILINHIRKLGCDLIIVDSDGDVTELIPLFLSVGVNAMLPFEVQAGMDVIRLREIYGRDLAMIGGLDKRVLALSFSDIEDEINQRLSFMLDSGGYIPALDHTAPPDVSLDHFRFYIEKVRSFDNH
jgi:hypothetical protein